MVRTLKDHCSIVSDPTFRHSQTVWTDAGRCELFLLPVQVGAHPAFSRALDCAPRICLGDRLSANLSRFLGQPHIYWNRFDKRAESTCEFAAKTREFSTVRMVLTVVTLSSKIHTLPGTSTLQKEQSPGMGLTDYALK